MARYKVYWKAATKEVQVKLYAEVTSDDYTAISDFYHDAEEDKLGITENHVVYHHVRDALYHVGEYNMQAITIAWDKTLNVTAISVIPATVELDLSEVETQQLTTVFTPANPDDTGLTYVSSDPTKATVSTTGLITPIAVGTATITVTSNDGSFTDTCVVTVVA